ncbi:MAG: glutamate ABC transporter substrate-binding protein [Cyanobacteria bacterium]|nr:glutamate ABC transporter substrate-binding protein [Cyanobacteriota bacterium]
MSFRFKIPTLSVCFKWLLLGFIISLPLLSGCNFSGVTSSDKTPPTLNQIKQRGKLIAGVKFDSKPFGYLDNDGQVKGFDVDLIREINRRVFGPTAKVSFQQVLSSTRIIAVNSGTVDIVAATMTITPERAEVIHFSNEYFRATQQVMVPSTSKAKKLTDLATLRILYVLGSTSEKNIRKVLPQAKYVGFKTAVDAFSALKAGRGDALTTDDTILAGFLADSCGYRLLPERLSSEPYGLGFRKDENSTASKSFIEAVNKAIAEIKADGTLKKIEQRWMSLDQQNHCP